MLGACGVWESEETLNCGPWVFQESIDVGGIAGGIGFGILGTILLCGHNGTMPLVRLCVKSEC